MSQSGPKPHSTSRPWAYAALTLVTLAVVASLAHQSEDQRLRQVEQDAAALLRADLNQALDFAFALQHASIRTPQLSVNGDTITFALPAPSGRVEELLLFVDPLQGGLCLVLADRGPELVAHSVDAFRATLEELELQTIHRVVREVNGNISLASKRLGISRNTIYRKLRRG